MALLEKDGPSAGAASALTVAVLPEMKPAAEDASSRRKTSRKMRGGKGDRHRNAESARSEAQDLQTVRDFLAVAAPGQLTGRILLEKGQVSSPAMEREELAGLTCLRNGLYLGEVRKGRFIPSQSLAMTLSAGACACALHLDSADERVIRYLKGETITLSSVEAELPGAGTGPEAEIQKAVNGYRLVCVDDWPLGWARQTGELLKNKYHLGWRMQ